jgi:hypothetical protein
MRSRSLGTSVLVLVLLAAGCVEDFHATYADTRALQQAGSGARSWFPAPLPQSAFQLEEWHNIDTNETVGRFHFRPEELQQYRQALASQRVNAPVASARLAMRDVAGWPQCLTGDVDGADVRSCRLEAYRLSGFQIVVDPKKCVAYFWTPRA